MRAIKRWMGVTMVLACGDAGGSSGADTGASTGPATTAATATSSAATDPPTSSPTVDPPADTSSSTSAEPTGEPPLTTTTTPSSTTALTATSTVGDTTATASSTGEPVTCTCEPGAPFGCLDLNTLEVCGDDCMGPEPQACADGQACLDGQGCVDVTCLPGTSACVTADSLETCKPDGTGYDPPVDCVAGEGCENGVCTALCVLAELSPRSLGCSFFAHTMDNYYPDVIDSVIVGNTHPSLPASVQLYVHKNGAEQAVGAPALVAPGAVHEFQLTEPEIESASEKRSDGAYRVASDLPIVAYQHAPRTAQLTNDASMLLPEPALARNYVIASAREGTLHKSHSSYFVIIAAEDDTTVTWNPPVATLAGTGVPGVLAGGEGEVNLDRLETLQVAAAYTVDLTGTYVSADKPIWVVGASACVAEPVGNYTCDHVEEQMLPIDYWGKTYVGAHAPKRGNEKYQWRVFGGEDGSVITTTPDVSGGPFNLDKGEVKTITTTQHFVFSGTGAFMPVQYLESQTAGAGTGDPSTVQMIPVEQFLDRYVFATGIGYTKNYVQVVRKAGGAPVHVDGVQVAGYTAIGAYELADWPIAEGSHLAESDDPFGIINIGYTDFTSYAYPGGMKLDVLTPQ